MNTGFYRSRLASATLRGLFPLSVWLGVGIIPSGNLQECIEFATVPGVSS